MGPIAFSSNAEPTYNLRFESTRPHPLPFSHPSEHIASTSFWESCLDIATRTGLGTTDKRPPSTSETTSKSASLAGRYSGASDIPSPSTASKRMSLASIQPAAVQAVREAAFMEIETIPAIARVTSTSPGGCPSCSKLVTLYADAYSDDDPSPIDAPRRAVWNPESILRAYPFCSIWICAWRPSVPKGWRTIMAASTTSSTDQYLDSNTNKGFLLGNAIGRDGRAIEGRSSYWFPARTRVEAGYRQNKISAIYFPGGGTITDGFVNAYYAIGSHWQADIFTQYERFLDPFLPERVTPQHKRLASAQMEPGLAFTSLRGSQFVSIAKTRSRLLSASAVRSRLRVRRLPVGLRRA